MALQPRDLETLKAEQGMRRKVTFEDIDYILSHQKTVKLPDRRWLQVWNSFDVQNFRGYNEDADEYEWNRNTNIKRTVEIREAANRDVPTADLDFMNRQQQAMGQMANAIQALQAQQDANDEIMRNRMRAEYAEALDHMMLQQHRAQEEARMHAEFTRRHVDRMAVDQQRMAEALDAIGARAAGAETAAAAAAASSSGAS